MKNYRRILVPLPADGRSEVLLRRAAEMLPGGRGELMVARVLDTRSGFESDGPAGRLPGEREARQVPGEKKRLDLLLARHKLGWAESRVLLGDPRPTLHAFIRDWRPDLVVTCARMSPDELGYDLTDEPPDVLTVKCHGLFWRLGERFGHEAPGHA